jgi:glucosamine--fructose-6-phosphate aminotransferase (isomerizing)
MCGIFGFVAKGNNKVNIHSLRTIASITERRGPHAWGMAWVDGAGKMRTYKQTGAISDSLGLLAMAKEARLLIGHCRYATHGDPRDNTNNHPHDAGDAWIVHNGVIGHYEDIADRHELDLFTECDSEVLGAMIRKFSGKPMARTAKACREAMGSSPFAMMALWPDRLIAARANHQPLHVGETRDSYYLASLGYGLPGTVRAFADGEIVEYA